MGTDSLQDCVGEDQEVTAQKGEEVSAPETGVKSDGLNVEVGLGVGVDEEIFFGEITLLMTTTSSAF
jgi:hypothetical protein